MKWLKSTSQKTWTIAGKIVPACVTPHNDYLCLKDEEYHAIAKRPVVASLIKNACILVLDQEPAELKNSVEALQGSNAELQAKITQQEEEIKQLKAGTPDVAAIREEAQAEIKAEAVKELQEKQTLIDQQAEEIKELKKQLRKAGKE